MPNNSKKDKDQAPSGDPQGNVGRNNPLGQRNPSPTTGGGIENLEHGQSGDAVDRIRQNAGTEKDKPAPKKSKDGYDLAGPDRQPTKVVRQSDLGKQPRQKQDGMYTQDNEEENPKV